jgi:uncharacterized repeat protein (TIGR02543 family)
VNGNMTVTANFTKNPTYSLTVEKNQSTGGTTTPTGSMSNISAGTQINIKAEAASGYTFANWTITGNGAIANASSASTSVTVNGDVTVTANFTLIPTYTLTVGKNPAAGGTTTPTNSQSNIKAGEKVSITATAASCYKFTNWTITGSGTIDNAASALTSVTVNGNVTVTANFQQNQYTLTTNVSGSGSVSRSPNQTTYACGTSVTLTATPASDNYAFDGWAGAATGMTNPLTITMDGNKTLTAKFRAKVQKRDSIDHSSGTHNYQFNKGFPATVEVYAFGAGGGGAGGSDYCHNCVFLADRRVGGYLNIISGGAGGGGGATYSTFDIFSTTTFTIEVGAGGVRGQGISSGTANDGDWNYGESGKDGGPSKVIAGSVTINAGGGGGGCGQGCFSKTSFVPKEGAVTPAAGGAGGAGKMNGKNGQNGMYDSKKGDEKNPVTVPQGGAGGSIDDVPGYGTISAGNGGRGGYDHPREPTSNGISGGNGRVIIKFTWWE